MVGADGRSEGALRTDLEEMPGRLRGRWLALGIVEPVRLPQRCQVGLGGCCVGEMLIVTEELEAAGGARLAQHSRGCAHEKSLRELQMARDSRVVRRSIHPWGEIPPPVTIMCTWG